VYVYYHLAPSDARYLATTLGLYGLAKLAELLDRPILAVVAFSGHTCKHLLAAAATGFILRWRLACVEKAPGRMIKSAFLPHEPNEAGYA
jgi:hypothetical protein